MILAASFDTKDPESWLNRGLMYGDGVFETMRMDHQKLPLWSFHMQRLRASLGVLGIMPPDEHELMKAIANHSPETLQRSAVIKPDSIWPDSVINAGVVFTPRRVPSVYCSEIGCTAQLLLGIVVPVFSSSIAASGSSAHHTLTILW